MSPILIDCWVINTPQICFNPGKELSEICKKYDLRTLDELIGAMVAFESGFIQMLNWDIADYSMFISTIKLNFRDYLDKDTLLLLEGKYKPQQFAMGAIKRNK